MKIGVMVLGERLAVLSGPRVGVVRSLSTLDALVDPRAPSPLYRGAGPCGRESPSAGRSARTTPPIAIQASYHVRARPHIPLTRYSARAAWVVLAVPYFSSPHRLCTPRRTCTSLPFASTPLHAHILPPPTLSRRPSTLVNPS